jgi:hypothetical protein
MTREFTVRALDRWEWMLPSITNGERASLIKTFQNVGGALPQLTYASRRRRVGVVASELPNALARFLHCEFSLLPRFCQNFEHFPRNGRTISESEAIEIARWIRHMAELKHDYGRLLRVVTALFPRLSLPKNIADFDHVIALLEQQRSNV